jgi:hypothetical protein
MYSNPHPHGSLFCSSSSYITTDGQSASLSWCQAPLSDPRQIFFLSWIIFRQLLIEWCGALSLTRSRICSFEFHFISLDCWTVLLIMWSDLVEKRGLLRFLRWIVNKTLSGYRSAQHRGLPTENLHDCCVGRSTKQLVTAVCNMWKVPMESSQNDILLWFSIWPIAKSLANRSFMVL